MVVSMICMRESYMLCGLYQPLLNQICVQRSMKFRVILRESGWIFRSEHFHQKHQKVPDPKLANAVDSTPRKKYSPVYQASHFLNSPC